MKFLVVCLVLFFIVRQTIQQARECYLDPDTSKSTFSSTTKSWNQELNCLSEEMCGLTYYGTFEVERTRSRCCKAEDDDEPECSSTTSSNDFKTNFTTMLQFSSGATQASSFNVTDVQSVIGNVDTKMWFRGNGSQLILKGENRQVGEYDPFAYPQLKLMPQGRVLLGSFDAPKEEMSVLSIESDSEMNQCTSQVLVYHGSLLMFADGSAVIMCQEKGTSRLVVGSDTGFSAWSTDVKPEVKVQSTGSCTSELSTKGRSQIFLTGSKMHVECNNDARNSSTVLGGYWSFSAALVMVNESVLNVGTRSSLLGFHESSMKLHDSNLTLTEGSAVSFDPRVGQLVQQSSIDVRNSKAQIESSTHSMNMSVVNVQNSSELSVRGYLFNMHNANLTVTSTKFNLKDDDSMLNMSNRAQVEAARSTVTFRKLMVEEQAQIRLQRATVKSQGLLATGNRSELVIERSVFSSGMDSQLRIGPETKMSLRDSSRVTVGDQSSLILYEHSTLKVELNSEVKIGNQAMVNLSAVVDLRGSSKIILEDRAELHAFAPAWCIISQNSRIQIHTRGRLIITSALFTPGNFVNIDIEVPEGQTKVWVVTPGRGPLKIYTVGEPAGAGSS